MQDVEDIKKNVMAKLNAASLEVFAIVKNFLNDATDIFKQKEKTLNRNEAIFFISLHFLFVSFTPVWELYCHTTCIDFLIQQEQTHRFVHKDVRLLQGINT
jgi:hypothetical protein